MRFAVLLLGFVGVLLTTAAAGAFFFYGMTVDMVKENVPLPGELLTALTQTESLTNQPHLFTALFCGIAALYGLLGTLLAFLRCGRQGGLLMLVPVLGAAIMNPFTLVLTNVQLFTAFLALFIGPLPINDDLGLDEDDDD